MQTERVTFLTIPDDKAAVDAFARVNGMSAGHVIREATPRYLADLEREGKRRARRAGDRGEPSRSKKSASIDHMIATRDDSHATLDAVLRELGVRR